MEALHKVQQQLWKLQQQQQQRKIQEETRATTKEVKCVSTTTTENVSTVFKFGGRIKLHLKEWRKITKDPFILECIQGCKINFLAEPIQIKKPHQINFNHKELQCVKTMLKEFIETGVIAPCSIEENDFINTVFLERKKILLRITLSIE